MYNRVVIPFTPGEQEAALIERAAIVEYLAKGGPYRDWRRTPLLFRIKLALCMLVDGTSIPKAACMFAAEKINEAKGANHAD